MAHNLLSLYHISPLHSICPPTCPSTCPRINSYSSPSSRPFNSLYMSLSDYPCTLRTNWRAACSSKHQKSCQTDYSSTCGRSGYFSSSSAEFPEPSRCAFGTCWYRRGPGYSFLAQGLMALKKEEESSMNEEDDSVRLLELICSARFLEGLGVSV